MGLLALLAGVIYVKTDHGELVVELSDPAANVDVRVNGQEVVLDPDGRAVRVRAGANQKLEVSGPDFETAGESFDLKRGGRTVVRVTLKPRAGVAQAPPTGPPVPGPVSKPEPAKPAPPKPVVFPERSTLVEAPGWQVLADATQEEMQKWLDARKADKHSVVWLDAIQVGDKPVFCAAAALDARAPDWRAFLAVRCPLDSNPLKEFRKVVDTFKHRLVSISAYNANGVPHMVSLWQPGATQFSVGVNYEPVVMDESIAQFLKNGFVVRLIRPYLIEMGVVAVADLIERAPGTKTAHEHGMTAPRFAEFLERHRKDGLCPVGVAAAPQDGALLLAATMSDRPARAAWEVGTDLTAQTLGTRMKEMVGRGFVPASVTACPWDGAVRYAGVWVKEPARKSGGRGDPARPAAAPPP
ncbi:MAG: hypothetical protein K2X82_11105, partial [Gemmataceae bacterium]|nr:hypothetical protein [Gemmataceae bacterium]